MRGKLALAALALTGVLTGCVTGNQVANNPASALKSTPTSTAISEGTQQALDQQLRQAAWKNDVPAARALIAKGANVNAKDSTQQSAYLIATSEGHQELLELTLASGGNVKDLDSWRGTGLIRAAERGHAGVLGVLLRAGIARDHVNRIGYQAIHEAIWLGRQTDRYADTVRVLVAGGVQLNRPSVRENLTPLAMAQRKGFTEMEKTLQRALDGKHRANLLTAAAQGDADAVALALRAGAKIETRDANGRTALLLAVAANQLPVARLLVAMGANVNAVDNLGRTALLEAVILGHGSQKYQHTVKLLLAAGADPNLADKNGITAAEHARRKGHTELLTLLQQRR